MFRFVLILVPLLALTPLGKAGGWIRGDELTRVFMYLGSPFASAKFERKSRARSVAINN